MRSTDLPDFDMDGVQDNIGFMVKRVRVHKPSAVNDVGYRFPGNYGVEKYLEKFSEENYDSFCLAYMFTYRDFEGGTLGLAWTGDLNQAGGVCEKNGHYRGSKKSLNSGIISILNYGKRVPPAVSHVTFAHEVGHNFGSQHDPDNNKECTPGGMDGNYIILRSINPVLRVKARSTHGCFVEPQAAICGNGVVEEGEECDCGWEEDCRETCCNPMSATPPKGRPPCQLRAGARCSPSQGPCCNDTCEFGYGQECRNDNGCRAKARCNGRSAECPPSIRKPDRTICNEGNVCFKGCEPEYSGNGTKSCELCCKRPGPDQPCISSFEWNSAPFDIPDQFSKPGTPCNQYTGYCDVFQMCREVDPIGPLATLKNLFLSDKSLSVVKEFMDRYWYMIVLCLIIVILSLIAVIRIFGKSPPKYHRRHRRRNSAAKKRPRESDVENPPLPDVTAGAEAAPAATETAETEPVGSERGRQPLKRRVDDVRRAAAKARRAASHMALSSRASVASGVARVTRRGKRDGSRPSGEQQRKRRRNDQSKSRGRRRGREQTKDGVKVISYSNKPAELGVTDTKAEPRLSGAAAKSAEAAASAAAATATAEPDKRQSLPAGVTRRKPTAPADAEKRRSLPKPPGSPQKPARQESPSKQRRSTADVAPARGEERERGRRQARDSDQRLGRSSSHRQRSAKRDDKKRSRSISPTKRPAKDSRQTTKPTAEDNKADKKKRFGLKHVTSADNVISDWLGRNAKKDNHKHKHGAERSRKKPIVPTAPMHPNDQVLQWLRTASTEPSGADVPDGLASPQPSRRMSLSSSQTSGSMQRPAGRPRYGRVISCDESSLAGRRQSASPARDTISSLGAASRRRGTSHSELSRSQPPPSDERLSFRAVPEAVYDLPRSASPERIYDLPSGGSPERQPSPPVLGRQMSVPAFAQSTRSGSPGRRPPERNISVPAGLHGHHSPDRPLPAPPAEPPLTEVLDEWTSAEPPLTEVLDEWAPAAPSETETTDCSLPATATDH
ncbi:Disintegrin and metalloproteinase domain-containing protein 10 [Amphibalanus amphitrite]|uniref:ADAM10 endopeptidase n=1 Tax=Amphibalanus amphitrite TaxID=1232801 RepID=A0A6A4XFC6_AMPAM|nr:Disintegrin and metalloproteinase domain-containing protein 10 [Amphibalanus amphitrite]